MKNVTTLAKICIFMLVKILNVGSGSYLTIISTGCHVIICHEYLKGTPLSRILRLKSVTELARMCFLMIFM